VPKRRQQGDPPCERAASPKRRSSRSFELEAGRPAAELARKHGVHVNTIRSWRAKYGGLDVSDLVRLKQLELENGQMERIIARQALEINAMKNLFAKNGWSLHGEKKR
jgi:putative transposase